LIVGGHDVVVIELNEQVLRLFHGPRRVVVVPGATYLFEVPSTPVEVARLAQERFVQ
jgi:hypothetical protein